MSKSLFFKIKKLEEKCNVRVAVITESKVFLPFIALRIDVCDTAL